MNVKLTPQFIHRQQKRLEEEKNKILQQIKKLKQDDPFSDPSYSSDNAAIDTDVREQFYHQTVEAQINNLKKRIRDIDLAFTRIEKGKYEWCKKCHKSIPLARLELIPEARYCVECEAKLRK